MIWPLIRVWEVGSALLDTRQAMCILGVLGAALIVLGPLLLIWAVL